MIPDADDIELRWNFSRLPRWHGLASSIGRCANSSVTLIIAEQSDHSWEITKMRGGQILDRRIFHNLPEQLIPHTDKPLRRRSRDRRTTTQAGRRSSDDANARRLASGSGAMPDAAR